MTKPQTSTILYALFGLIAASVGIGGLGAANVDTTPIRDFLLWVIAGGAGWYASLFFAWAKPRAQALADKPASWARLIVWYFADPRMSALTVFVLSVIIASGAHMGISWLDGQPIDQIGATAWAFLASQARYAWVHGIPTPPASKAGD